MKTHKTTLWLLAVLCLFSLSSCTNTIIKVFFKKDGSGTYSYIQDYSATTSIFGDMAKSRLADEMRNGNMVTSMQDSLAGHIGNIEGISKVRTHYDEEAMQMILSFDFEDVSVIDKALESMFGEIGIDTDKPFFRASSKRFERSSRQLFTASSMAEFLNSGIGSIEDTEGMEGLGSTGEIEDMIKMINRDTYMEFIIEFERKISSFSNKEYKQIDDHTLKWRQFTFDEDDKEMDIAVKVKLK